jgi:hypothetical protein
MPLVKAMLVGGAPASGDEGRVVDVRPDSETIKVDHGSYYDHFRDSGAVEVEDGEPRRVYRWYDRTRVAE